MTRQATFILIISVFLVEPCMCLAATEIIQIGIASPQNEAEKSNTEKLRERAIRNAIDLAVMQVTGTMISSERKSTIRSRDDVSIHDGQAVEKTRQESRSHTGATSRIEGHARLVTIVKEWQEGDLYFVEAKIAVESPEDTMKLKNCGDYWLQAGKPPISMSFAEEFNGEISENQQDYTLRFLRDNLARNGVTVSSAKNPDSQYQIKILQSLKSNKLVGLDTITMSCRVFYQIIDRELGESVAEYRATHGPQAGFTVMQAKENCIKSIAQDVSENLIRSLGKIMIERWNNGVEQQLIITGMPGQAVAAATEILQNLYRVTYSTPAKYTNGQYSRTMKFKGSATDLAQAIQDAFADEDWNVTIARIAQGEIYLTWTTTH